MVMVVVPGISQIRMANDGIEHGGYVGGANSDSIVKMLIHWRYQSTIGNGATGIKLTCSLWRWPTGYCIWTKTFPVISPTRCNDKSNVANYGRQSHDVIIMIDIETEIVAKRV
jgi:hypothetical protein